MLDAHTHGCTPGEQRPLCALQHVPILGYIDPPSKPLWLCNSPPPNTYVSPMFARSSAALNEGVCLFSFVLNSLRAASTLCSKVSPTVPRLLVMSLCGPL